MDLIVESAQRYDRDTTPNANERFGFHVEFVDRRLGAAESELAPRPATLRAYVNDACSDQVILDDVFARLLSFPNVLITAHQAFLTHEALEAIADTTLQNVIDLAAGRPTPNEVLS